MNAKKDWGLTQNIYMLNGYCQTLFQSTYLKKTFAWKYSQTFRKVAQNNILYLDSPIVNPFVLCALSFNTSLYIFFLNHLRTGCIDHTHLVLNTSGFISKEREHSLI